MADIFEKLEQQKARMLAAVAPLPEARLQFRPQPTSWCAIDVLDHLVKVERAFLDQVRNNLPRTQPVTAAGRIRAFLLNTLMLSPVRVKVPAGAERMLPTDGVTLQATGEAWSSIRRDLGELVAQISPEQRKVGVFLHPVSGWMPLGDGLAFLSAHLRHHEYQLDRIQKAARLS